MTGDELPRSDNVVRHVKGTQIGGDGTVDFSAFVLSEQDWFNESTPGLSVNWLEETGYTEKLEQIAKVRCYSNRNFTSTHRYAELNVGQVLDALSPMLDQLKIVHSPKPKPEYDPTHSSIEGLPEPGTDFAEKVGFWLAECVLECYPTEVKIVS